MDRNYGFATSDLFGGVLGLVIIAAIVAIYIIPIVRIIQKAGYTGWWSLVLLIPVVNVIMLWVFAFADWPSLNRRDVAGTFR